MKRLTQEQLADLSTVVNKITRDMVQQVLAETGEATENDKRTIAIASMCAAQAAAFTLTYLYETEDSAAPTAGSAGSSLPQ